MNRLRLINPPVDETDPAVLPFPKPYEREDTWQADVEAIEHLMDRIQTQVNELATEVEAETYPLVFDDDDDRPTAA
ncbi:MAG: hypothetical protein KAS72_12395 [Phycisphaerales bacterium]|nr:hypothetical protein [Phycisphaerales bacterium]